MTTFRTTVLALTLAAGTAQACETDPAVSYLKYIEAMDWDAMKETLHVDARYYDPTMTFYDRDAIDLKGPDAIVEFWKSSSVDSGTEKIDYTYRECFDTAGYHVVHYDLTVTVSGTFWNVNKETVEISGSVTSIIRIVDDKVIEHQDYVDYASAEDDVMDLQRRYGTLIE